MAVAHTCFNYRHLCIVNNALDKTLATAWNKHIYIAAHTHQGICAISCCIFNKRNGSLANHNFKEAVNGEKISSEELTFDFGVGEKTEINIDFETEAYFDKRPYNLNTVKCGSLVFSVPVKFEKKMQPRGIMPMHIMLEEAHRYVQKDRDVEILGYNIFERIAKEGRKYGVILGIIIEFIYG